MLYLIIKAAVSGVIIALGSEVARRYPGWGALIISLPLVSILGMIWLWREQVMRLAWPIMPRRPSGSFCPACPCSSSFRPCSGAAWRSGLRLPSAAP